jgi:PAS domain S-box-containing protein
LGGGFDEIDRCIQGHMNFLWRRPASLTNETLEREIAARKSAEERLRNSEARNRAIFDKIPDGIITINHEGFVESINPAAQCIFGQTAGEIIGQQVSQLFPGISPIWLDEKPDGPTPDPPAKAFALQRRATGRGKGGDTLPVEVTIGEMPRTLSRSFVMVVRDLSERKQFEESLASAQNIADRANRARSEFLATMSHEIRTPMNAIVGMGDLLAETPLSVEQKEHLMVLRRAGASLLDLINDILDFSNMEVGRLELERVSFELENLVQKTISDLRDRAHQKGLNLGWRIFPGVPNKLNGDAGHLRQILINLLGNAIKFTDTGEVVLEIKTIDHDSKRDCLLQFSVRDTGIGLAADKAKTIFDPFTQADSSATRKYGGTGLGLAICKRLTALMGGRIWVESHDGQGSTFYFTVRLGVDPESATPFSRSSVPEAPPMAARADEVAERAVPADALPAKLNDHPIRILLAEDTKDNQALIQAYLRKGPYELEMAENGEIAVKKFAAGHFDLVFMDMQMPVMDGYSATQAIRQWEREHGREPTPIVALTACALREEAEKSFAAGCTAHVTKPIRKAEFIETISQYLGSREL